MVKVGCETTVSSPFPATLADARLIPYLTSEGVDWGICSLLSLSLLRKPRNSRSDVGDADCNSRRLSRNIRQFHPISLGQFIL